MIVRVFEAVGLVAALCALGLVLRRPSPRHAMVRISLCALLGMFAFNHLANLFESFGLVWADTFADQLSLLVPVLWGLFLLECGRVYVSERLRASDEQVRFFLENVPASVAWLDAETKLVGCSQAFLATLPRAKPGLELGKMLPVVLPELAAAVACCLSGDGDTGLTEESAEIDDTRRYFRWSVRRWSHPDRPEPGMLLLFEELTAEREAETQRLLASEELARTQRLADVGQLAAGAAHDFNNFLQSMHTALYELELEPHPEQQAALGNIRQALESAGKMTHSLLHFGSGQSSPPGLVDVRALLNEVQGPLAHALGRRHRLVITLPPEDIDLTVWGHASRLQQALLNLAVNARDAMPRGGTIRLMVAREGCEVVLSVSDSGVGMSEAVQRQLFTPFFTTKGALGTGLGLRVVRGAVEEHKGSVAVESQPGVGTTFRLRLPLFDASRDEAPRLS